MTAQRRMIHNAFFTDEFVGALTMMERVLWTGLIVTCADDQGRLANQPAVIRAMVFPYDDIPLADITAAIEKFCAAGRLHSYTADSRPLLQIINWWRYQQPSWAAASKYAAPDGWLDRVRQHNKELLNWNKAGGFVAQQPEPAPEPPAQPAQEALPTHLPTPLPTPLPKGIELVLESVLEIDSESVKQQQESSAREKSPKPRPTATAAAKSPSPYPNTPLEAGNHPDIVLFNDIAGIFPGQGQYKTIIDTFCLLRQQHPGVDLRVYLPPYLNAWSGRKNKNGHPYDPANIGWLTEWAINGRIPNNGSSNSGASKPNPGGRKETVRERLARQVAESQRLNGHPA